MNNKNLSCPFCGGGGDKFGIYLNDRGSGSFHCMRCDQKGSIFKFLKKIGENGFAPDDRRRGLHV